MSSSAYRKSGQRAAVLAAVRTLDGHSTANEIFQAVRVRYPRISLGTVYRNLRILCAQGEIREVRTDEALGRYEIARPSHYHFVCRACGRIEDCHLPIDRSIEQRVQSSTSFRIENHRLEFIGLCSCCQSTADADSLADDTTQP